MKNEIISKINAAASIVLTASSRKMVLVEAKKSNTKDLLLNEVITEASQKNIKPVYFAPQDTCFEKMRLLAGKEGAFTSRYSTGFFDSRLIRRRSLLVIDDLEFAVRENSDMRYHIGENPIHFVILNELSELAKELRIPVVVVTHPVKGGANGHLEFDDDFALPTFDPFSYHIICKKNDVIIKGKGS